MNAHRPVPDKPGVVIVLHDEEELKLLRFGLDLVHQQLYDGANQTMEAAHLTALSGEMLKQLPKEPSA